MEYFSAYIKSIAYFVIFMAFIEIIAPSGGFKGCIRLILSLVLITLVIEPFGLLAGASGTTGGFEGIYFRLANQPEFTFSNREKQMYDEQAAEAILSEYKKGLEQETLRVITERSGLTSDNIKSIRVNVNGDYESEVFGEITGADVAMALAKDSEVNNSAAKRLLLGSAVSSEDSEQTAEVVSKKIKNILADFYNVHESNIHITVTDK